MDLTEHQTLAWHAYHDMIAMIQSGVLRPGSRLDEQELANTLGVSRTPLREAIARLVKDGLVVHQPYRGNSIRSFTAREAFDIYEVRKGLEVMAVRLAVPKCTPASITALRVCLARIDTALKSGDLVAYSLGDQDFHDTIANLSENETLIRFLGQLRGQIQLIRIVTNRIPDIVEITAMERPAIVDAMEDGDVECAMGLMEEHIELVQRSVAAGLESIGVRGPALVSLPATNVP